ncbi:MAG: DUF3347 domain-containing protein [Bacteroidota bacterium]
MKKYLSIGALLLVLACNSKTDKSVDQQDTTAHKISTTSTTNLSFESDSVQNLYNAYIGLKDALVATKFEDAKQKAAVLATALKNHSGCENTALIANKIENSNDIKSQRKEFTALSTDVIALFKHAELKSGTIYVQRCPMANNGDGGEWLASEKKIQNPYNGDEMMECGAVLEEIKTK